MVMMKNMNNNKLGKEIFADVKNSNTLAIIELDILGSNKFKKNVEESIKNDSRKERCRV